MGNPGLFAWPCTGMEPGVAICFAFPGPADHASGTRMGVKVLTAYGIPATGADEQPEQGCERELQRLEVVTNSASITATNITIIKAGVTNSYYPLVCP